MSKAIISEKAEPRELKALYIVGPEIEPNPEILKLYDRKDCLVVGDGIDDADIYAIYLELKKHNVQIGPNTRIDIAAHGKRVDKKHYLRLSTEEVTETKKFLQQLQGSSPIDPIYVHLWSCYGGTANKDIAFLNPGSIIVTHVKSQYSSFGPADNFAHLHSITRYINEKNLTPHLQYLYDQLENYQATTFNQKESDDRIVKFKTTRTPEHDSMANIISNILEQKQPEELLKEFQNYLNKEAENFSKLFREYLSSEDKEKFQHYTSNISDKDLKNYVTGLLLNIANLSNKDNIKDKEKILTILNNIVNNLGIETINHNILGTSLLAVTVRNNNVELTKALLNKGADQHAKYTKIDTSLLYIACLNKSVDIAKLLLEYNVDPNYPTADNDTPLLQACEKKSPELVKALLAKNADPNKVSDRGLSPLIVSCISPSEESREIALNLLASKNIKVNILGPNDFTPLILACYNNSERVVQALLDKEADVNAKDKDGFTPLFAAYRNHSTKITELLLEKGANPDVINPKTKSSILYNACNEGDLNIIKLLLKHKANPNLTTFNGTTPLMAACEKGDLEIAALLLKNGADINKSNNNGDNALFLACKNGNLELVKMLVENGVDLKKGSRGMIASSIAKKNGYEKVGAFLEAEIKSQRTLNTNQSNNPLPPKPPRLIKNTTTQNEENKKTWIKSEANLTSSQPHYNFLQSNSEAKSRALREINPLIEAAIKEVDKVNTVNIAVREEVQSILSKELLRIPINNLVDNKKGIINQITKELKLNNSQDNNNREYKISQQSLKEIGNKIFAAYGHKIQPQLTNTTTRRWQNYIKTTNNNANKSNYFGKR
ncbi:MAG: ankyrin repeat domain-containing protein [Rickettsia endosymbiont of Graphium doson]|nr:ankyrin repeat domain-containing protein [Rickettsia endosymbiont of Graphium doson]